MSDSGQSASGSHSTSSTAASAPTEEFDPELYAAVQARLLRSGEWMRLQTLLQHKLSEAGYIDDLLSLAHESLRSDPAQRFQALLTSLHSYGLRRLPESVRREMQGLLGEWLERNLRAP
ncbi:hypothetical protein CALVIDRAFT_536422 [Calocera viscosa TUFC12733]|uniref:Uncharacterized protein n=1 Tax=Calocera viscosa (strain TUFC12733) TaxID=1330018 RepID=A0A167N700_CALVF|nr:hypothetical protein CALVIDRAFT_536422 [Calocera viscosa TUFC12733]